MPLYMYQVSYTPEAVAALVREPQDRAEAVRPVIEALGGKLVEPATRSVSTTRLSCTRRRMTRTRLPSR